MKIDIVTGAVAVMLLGGLLIGIETVVDAPPPHSGPCQLGHVGPYDYDPVPQRPGGTAGR